MIFTEYFIRQCFAANERIPQRYRDGPDAFHHAPNPKQKLKKWDGATSIQLLIEMLRLRARETPMRIEAQSMPARALTDVSLLAGLIQLREVTAAVNEKHLPTPSHHNAGTGMRHRRGRGA